MERLSHKPPVAASSSPADIAQWQQELDEAQARMGWLEAQLIRQPRVTARQQGQLRHIVARICLGEKWSKMTAASRYSDHSMAELIQELEQFDQKTRQSRRRRAGKLRRRQAERQAVEQCFADLSQAYDTLAEQAHATAVTSEGQQEPGTVLLTTCGHAAPVKAITGCQQRLCAGCHCEASTEGQVDDFQLDCRGCGQVCSLLVLSSPPASV